MRSQYGEYTGQPFPTPDSLFPQPKVIELILQYGQKALDAMENLEEPSDKEFVEQLVQAGLLERDENTGALRLTPKMLRGIEHRALLEIFRGLSQGGNREGHLASATGRSEERADGSRTYQFGDPIHELDLAATLRNAMHRAVVERSQTGEPAASRGGTSAGPSGLKEGEGKANPAPGFTAPATGSAGPSGLGNGGSEDLTHPTKGGVARMLPLRIQAGDFEVYNLEAQSDLAVCLLLDLSGSMMRYGRFYHAKRVALGLQALIRRQFPQDTLDFVGFYSTAAVIAERDLPLTMPKPISVYDHTVRLKLPLAQALDNPRKLPQHFTNLHLGLRLARRVLARRPAANRQIIIITDGQPTAHIEPGPDGADWLHLVYPPGKHTATLTLKEALMCMQQGIRIATFALIEDYWGMEWVGFVDQLTRLTRGVAYYCSSDNLSNTVIESYLAGKRRRSYIA